MTTGGTPLAREEQRLVRLFRLLDGDARSGVLENLWERCLRSYSSEAYLDYFPDGRDEWLREEAAMGFDERLGRTWPSDWPDRVFDLDDLGDPGIVLQEVVPCLGSGILGSDAAAVAFVDVMEDLWRSEAHCGSENSYKMGEDIYVDCCDGEDGDGAAEWNRAFRRSAHAFLLAWQDNLLQLLERRIALPPAPKQEGDR